jgi:D-alanyl-D-alanine endopeptidase (penicillin-binding protein 7)
MYRILPLLVFLALLYNGQAIATPAKSVPITAQSWLVADGDGKIIQGENTTEIRSIASISKLVLAMVVLDAKQDLDEYIKPYTRRELLKLSIIKSNNAATDILCNNYPGGRSNCIKSMNDKARSLSLSNTRFVEPTGLSVFNVSTAEELIAIVTAASHYTEIVEDSKTSQLKIKNRKQWFTFNNTNPIVGKRHNFIVSKTGYIRASGGCIVMMLDTEIGRRIVVLLGSRNTSTRIPEAEFIAGKF